MRPITHPEQPDEDVYPEFRTDTDKHLDDDLEVYTWKTTAQAPYEYFGLDDLSAADALRHCLLELILRPPPRKPKKRAKVANYLTLSDVGHYAELFRDRVYPTANTPLYDALGRYCSYCEQRLTETIAVEHVVPKAPYPLTSLCWENFLLSCRACNSRKLNQPSRDEAWLAPSTGELDRYKRVRAHYLLPDDSTNAYWSLQPALWVNQGKGKGWVEMDAKASVSDRIVQVSKGNAATKLPRASVPGSKGGLVSVDVQVRMDPSAPSLTSAQASFAMLGFGSNGVGSSDDNRMWDRSNAWLLAVDQFRRLGHTTDFANQWDALCELAGKTGFLTTWVRVLDLRGGATAPYPPPPAKKTSTLLKQFLLVMTQQRKGMLAPEYPSTDLDYLPPNPAP